MIKFEKKKGEQALAHCEGMGEEEVEGARDMFEEAEVIHPPPKKARR